MFGSVFQLPCRDVISYALVMGVLSATPSWADDFNRPDVPYTNAGHEIGWYWQASGGSHWSLNDHQILVDNSDVSLQEPDQILYHTRVALTSGDWSASLDVRCDTASRRVGIAFMVGAGGVDHYQIRLQAGSKQVQVLQRGSAGAETLYSNSESSSEIFATGSYYTIRVWSEIPHQFQWSIRNATGTLLANGSFSDADYTTGHVGLLKSVGDGNADLCRFDNFHVRELTVPPITQPHPRLLVDDAEIAMLQSAIQGQVEPRYSAWLNLKLRADGWSDDPVAAPYTGGDSFEFIGAARAAGHRASKMALAYLLAGEVSHRNKAREILLTWARATPLPGTAFDETLRFPSSAMDLSRGILGLVYTYDWLHDELSAAERSDVEHWFRSVLPSVQTGIDRWNTPFKRSTTDPRGWIESADLHDIYFKGQLFQNHLVSHTMAFLMIGYALGDRDLVQFALDSQENPRDLLELFEGMILMAGDPFVGPPDTLDPPPQDGEIVDRYRQVTNNGLSYAVLSLSQMMAMTEVLFGNGINLYSRVGAYGETMELPYQFYADFFRTQDDTIKGGFYEGESFVSVTWPIALFEVANRRYPGNPEIEALLRSVDRPGVDAAGNVGTYLCYPTLTHGLPLSPEERFGDWLAGHGLVAGIARLEEDPDFDLMSNLVEYALGGDPTLSDAVAILPTPSMVEENGSRWLEFEYSRRLDAVERGLTYSVRMETDLANPVWSSGGVSETGTDPVDANFERVTNSTPMDADAKFLRLHITLGD